MGYTLQAIILNNNNIANSTIENSFVVPRPQNVSLIPLIDSILKEYKIPFLPFDEVPNIHPSSIFQPFLSASKIKGNFIYIEAMFHGGQGYQVSVLWENGTVREIIKDTPDAINIALRFIGIQKTHDHDEFDTIGLGDHRDTNNWIPK